MIPSMVRLGPAVLDTRMLLFVAGWIGVRVLLDHVTESAGAAAPHAFDWASVGSVIGGKAWAVTLNPALLTVPEVLFLGDVMTVTGAVLGAALALAIWLWRTRSVRRDPARPQAAGVSPFLSAVTLFASWAFLVTGATGGGWRWITGAGLIGAAAALSFRWRRGTDPWLTMALTALGLGLGWLTVATAPGLMSAWQAATALILAGSGGLTLYRRLGHTP